MTELKEEIKTAEELYNYLRDFCGFSKPTQEEKKGWGYKNELFISPKFLIGRVLYENKTHNNLGVVKSYDLEFRKSKCCFRIETDKGFCFLTNTYVKFHHPENGSEINQALHPTRGGLKLWSRGYFIPEKEYKSLYYKTEEYKRTIGASLEERYGVKGVCSPFQIKEVREKASQSIFDKYGVNSFLERGPHYSAITESMIEKYGVDNLFKDYEWQMKEMDRKVSLSGSSWFNSINSTSKFEKEVVNLLVREFGLKDCFHIDSELLQKKIVYLDEKSKKKVMFLDFYCPNKKVIIECNGDYWHCNPKKYSSDYYHKHKKKLAREVWRSDAKRESVILDETGIRPFVIWEDDWNKSRELVMKNIRKIMS